MECFIGGITDVTKNLKSVKAPGAEYLEDFHALFLTHVHCTSSSIMDMNIPFTDSIRTSIKENNKAGSFFVDLSSANNILASMINTQASLKVLMFLISTSRRRSMKKLRKQLHFQWQRKS